MTILFKRKGKAFTIMVLFVLLDFVPLACPDTISYSSEVDFNPSKQYTTDISNDAKYYAVIIGVEKFQGIELPEENYIDETAQAIYEKLLMGNNWKIENIKLLINENATKENIQNAITTWLSDKESKEDVVLYYFVGHSWKMPFLKRFKGNTYSLPYDVSVKDYSEDAITDVELDSWLDTLDSRHVAVILDTCFSGRMTALRQLGRVILAAGGKYLFCPVDEDDTLRSGIFSHFLMQGLDGVADRNNDGWITAEEVFRYARIPTFHFSFWKNFPFIGNFPFFTFPQCPYMYDRHLFGLQLYNLPFGWKQITENGFGRATNLATRGMTIYKDELYIGTQNIKLPKSRSDDTSDAVLNTIYHRDLGTLGWLPYLYRFPMKMALHLAARASNGCEIWKYNYTTDTLTQVIGNQSTTGMGSGFDYTFNCAAAVMKEFKGKLYVGTWSTPLGSIKDPHRKGCEVWRYNGTTWDQVVGHYAPIMKGGFNNPDNVGAWSIEEFEDQLYIGTMNWDFAEQGGCEIWRTADGTHWEQVVDSGFQPNMTIFDIESGVMNTYAWSMEVFKEQLYVGTLNSRFRIRSDIGMGCQLWRTNDGKTWSKVPLPDGTTGGFKDGFGELENYGIRRMVVYNDELFVGTAASVLHDKGCEIWKYDGNSWTPIIGDDVPKVDQKSPEYDGFGNPMNKYVWSMTVTSDNKLWVGTANCQFYNPFEPHTKVLSDNIEPKTEGCEVWCYDGNEWIPIVENNDGIKPSGFGEIKNEGARSMLEYPRNSGNIAVGTFKLVSIKPDLPEEGCELWLRYK